MHKPFRLSKTQGLQLLLLVLILVYGMRYYYKYIAYVDRVSLYHVYIKEYDSAVVNSGNQKLVEVKGSEAPYELWIEVSPFEAKHSEKIDSKPYEIPSKYVNSDAEAIIKQGKALIGETSEPFDQAKRIVKWVSESIEYDPQTVFELSREKLATDTLTLKKGSVQDIATLSAALLRSQGIPARVVYGHQFNNSKAMYYAWNEVYLPQKGWMPVDPTTGKMTIDSRYIRLFIDKETTANDFWDESLKIGVERVNW